MGADIVNQAMSMGSMIQMAMESLVSPTITAVTTALFTAMFVGRKTEQKGLAGTKTTIFEEEIRTLLDNGRLSYREFNQIKNYLDVLNTNGWKYGYSYKASRILLENAYKKNPSLDFFIDLHRDAASYDRTVTEIDGKKYAKILFVVGLEHENYEPNLQLARTLNERIKKIAPTLSRGVLEKKGPGVNGKYNQDFNKNTILIEVGGQYNYIEEVNNTLKIIAKVIYEYLEDEKEN